ncbi:flavin reductase family protein [Brachybacterium squillarum]|uniref:flavin reductase family protein n=1 Tax=Brachybacterium squillarum TaxID=661979 RepID=UPI000262977F|nr:iron-sulfur cluster-binding domain-containing protein [Brachybacterium squillarum]
MTSGIAFTAEPVAHRIRGIEMPWNRVLSAAAGPAGAAKALGPWYPQEFWAECVMVNDEAGDMKTFVFRRFDGAPLAFRAGQYLNIAFPVHGPDEPPVDRSYSISSAPTEPWTFAVTIKRDENGVVSPWAHEHIRPGTTLEMLGPVGAFHLPDEDRRARYLLLGAGSGITPLMSMVRTLHALPGRADVVLLYHGPRPGAFGFSKELEYLASVDSRLKVHYSLGDRSVEGLWEGMVGRLTGAMIEAVAPDANGRQVFACGPSGYLDVAAELLRAAGVDDTSVHMEYFTGDRSVRAEYREEVAYAEELAEEVAATWEEEPLAPELGVYGSPEMGSGPESEYADGSDATGAFEAGDGPKHPTEIPVTGVGQFTIAFRRSGKAVRADGDTTVLAAARSVGVRIGANCQEGMCGSCKSLKLSGEVDMQHQGGIRAREVAAGMFLPCCSRVMSDVEVEA